MTRLQLFHTSIVVFAGLLFFSGCSEKPAEEPEAKAPTESIDIQIAIDSEIRSYIQKATALFTDANVTLPNGTTIVPRYIEMPGSLARDQIASGKTKVDGWITQRAQVELTNATIRNLGAPQVDCIPLIATPMVFATTRQTASTLNLENSELDITRVMEFEKSNQTIGKTSFLFSDPIQTTQGLHALLQLTHIAGDTPAIYDYIFSATSGYNASTPELLRKIVTEESPHRHFVITSERSVALFNDHLSRQATVALYPMGGSVWQDYQLCRSDVEWVNPSKQAALRLLGNFFADKAQAIAHEEGFRPAHALTNPPADSLLTTGNGITPDLQLRTVSPVSSAVLQKIFKKWNLQQRPLSVVFVVDTSGSLEETGVGSIVSAVQGVATRFSLNDRMSIVTVSTEAETLLEPTSDRSEFFDALGKIESIGGTALYDGVLKALQLATRSSPPEYRSVIVVISDGPDKNSVATADLTRHTVRQGIISRDIPLYFVTLTDSGSDFTDLKSMASEIFAMVRPATFEDLPQVLESIWNEL